MGWGLGFVFSGVRDSRGSEFWTQDRGLFVVAELRLRTLNLKTLNPEVFPEVPKILGLRLENDTLKPSPYIPSNAPPSHPPETLNP